MTEVRLRLQDGYDTTVDSVIIYRCDYNTSDYTHNFRLYYNSSTHVQDTRNLAHESPGSKNGVLWSDLKYAIRVHVLIKAIEATYPSLSFSTDFFNTSNTRYHNLYLWMQRKKGNLVEDDQEFTSQVTGFSGTPSPVYVSTSPIATTITVERKITNISLTTVMSDTSVLYDVLIYRDGAVY